MLGYVIYYISPLTMICNQAVPAKGLTKATALI